MPGSLKRLIKRGNRLRVLVVDDSVVIRRLVTHALEQDASLELAGTAANGAIALARIPQLNPDVLTLDIDMPEMDGLETLRQLRKTYKDIRVIMFSTLTERGATATIDALSLGADDYVTKASNEGSLDHSLSALQRELIPKIKQFFTFESDPAGVAAAPTTRPAAARLAGPVRLTARTARPRVLAIGVSTGGPTALAQVIPHLPADYPLPVLIVQHMPPVFTRLLAERLQVASRLKVQEAAAGMEIERGNVYIAPGDYHMRVAKRGQTAAIALDQGPSENSCRPAVDVLFRSVEEVYGADVLSLILTGMGQDGLRGAEVLKARGAELIAQDEASSVVWGMPGAVVNAGLADAVVPLEQVVPEILRRTGL